MKKLVEKILTTSMICSVLFAVPAYSGGSVPVRIIKGDSAVVESGRGWSDASPIPSSSAHSGTAKETIKNVVMNDKIKESARIYVLGILGGDRNEIFKAPSLFRGISDNEIFSFLWMRESVFPASTWSLGQSVIETIQSTNGNMIEITFYAPDIEPYIDSKLPRPVAEWKIYDDLLTGTITPKGKLMNRTVAFNELGLLFFPNEESRNKWMKTPEIEIKKTLAWCIENKKAVSKPIRNYMSGLQSEMKYSVTISIPKEIDSLMSRFFASK